MIENLKKLKVPVVAAVVAGLRYVFLLRMTIVTSSPLSIPDILDLEYSLFALMQLQLI